MTHNPRDTSVLIRVSARRLTSGLPQLLVAVGLISLLTAAVSNSGGYLAAVGSALVCVVLAGSFVLLRQLYALTEISRRGIHKAGAGLDLGFRSWDECATVHRVWPLRRWYLGRNLAWAMYTGAYLPDPRLLDDNNVRLLCAVVEQFAPADHPLLARLHADPHVQMVLQAAEMGRG